MKTKILLMALIVSVMVLAQGVSADGGADYAGCVSFTMPAEPCDGGAD